MANGTQNADQLVELASLRVHLASLPDSPAKRDVESEAVLKLILRGWSYGAVAAALGMSKTTAHRRVQHALAERVNPLVDKHREIATARLDAMTSAVTRVIDAQNASYADRVAAVRTWVSIETRRAAVLGTDTPIRSVVTTIPDSDDSELLAAIARARAELLAERSATGEAAHPDVSDRAR